jgi:hypothetical protein
VLKPLGSSNPNLRLGDFYRKGMLQHYISPFSLKRDIRRQGFTLELFVGSSTLDRGRRATSFTNFFPDRCFFNVLKKLTSLRQ